MQSISSCTARAAVVLGAMTLAACASAIPVEPSVLSGASFRVVTAREAGGGRGPIGIADRFTSDGQVFAFVSIVWPSGHNVWGTQTFESRWYSGDRLVVKRDFTIEVTKSPFNFWSSVFPVNLGQGNARYELYVGGTMVAEKSFEIADPIPRT